MRGLQKNIFTIFRELRDFVRDKTEQK